VRRWRGFRRRTTTASSSFILLSVSDAGSENEGDQNKQKLNESLIQLGQFTAS
jgi:hypothetical protein